MSNARRAQRAQEAHTDALLSRIYWLRNESQRRALTSEETTELAEKGARYESQRGRVVSAEEQIAALVVKR